MKKENKALGCVIGILLLLICVGFCFTIFKDNIFGNKQFIDFNYKFNTAYIEFPDGTTRKIIVKKWNDFENSDSIQIIDDNGKLYFTHLNRVVLTKE